MLREHTVKISNIYNNRGEILKLMAKSHNSHEVILPSFSFTLTAVFDHEDEAENFQAEADAFMKQQDFLDGLSEEEAYSQYRLFI